MRRWRWERTSTKHPSSSVWPEWYTAPPRLEKRTHQQTKVLNAQQQKTLHSSSSSSSPPEETPQNRQRSYLVSQIWSPRYIKTDRTTETISTVYLRWFYVIRLKSLLMLDVTTSRRPPAGRTLWDKLRKCRQLPQYIIILNSDGSNQKASMLVRSSDAEDITMKSVSSVSECKSWLH